MGYKDRTLYPNGDPRGALYFHLNLDPAFTSCNTKSDCNMYVDNVAECGSRTARAVVQLTKEELRRHGTPALINGKNLQYELDCLQALLRQGTLQDGSLGERRGLPLHNHVNRRC